MINLCTSLEQPLMLFGKDLLRSIIIFNVDLLKAVRPLYVCTKAGALAENLRYRLSSGCAMIRKKRVVCCVYIISILVCWFFVLVYGRTIYIEIRVVHARSFLIMSKFR